MVLKDYVAEVPNFPAPGVLFYDISPLLARPAAWNETLDRLAETVRKYRPDVLAGIESRGFLVAAPLAAKLSLGFVMVRKKNKLPGTTIPYTYDLEYGRDTIEVQANAIQPGQKVFVLDDLLATGGTMSATVQLLRNIGAKVEGCACIIELAFLKGREKLDTPFTSLLSYDQSQLGSAGSANGTSSRGAAATAMEWETDS